MNNIKTNLFKVFLIAIGFLMVCLFEAEEARALEKGLKGKVTVTYRKPLLVGNAVKYDFEVTNASNTSALYLFSDNRIIESDLLWSRSNYGVVLFLRNNGYSSLQWGDEFGPLEPNQTVRASVVVRAGLPQTLTNYFSAFTQVDYVDCEIDLQVLPRTRVPWGSFASQSCYLD